MWVMASQTWFYLRSSVRFIWLLMWLAIGLNANMLYKKNWNCFRVDQQPDLQNVLNCCILICCNYLHGGVSECICFMHKGNPSSMKLQNFNVCFIELGQSRSGSVYDHKTILLFSLATFGTNFDMIFWDEPSVPTYRSKSTLKSNRFV